uniref:Gamma-aminobutyric acid type B receptor subunit 2-like n=1 Tax=Saccoglossus kowalevskii TaxID=10224 RepID=A0ABM0M1T3_SACKO|nr:PREDICTED: gamma-aminobutyric acid type B receptor subunit 2-like [Saccoglossus kowalevskii]
MASGPKKLMILGGICSNVTAPIAEAVIWWNLTQLSYANMEPFLSEREKYPTFFRTVPSEADFNPAKLKLLEYFNWTHVATIHQDTPRFSVAHNKLSKGLEDVRKHLILVQSFSTDPESAVQAIKDSGARIILGLFDEHMAREVFCHTAYEYERCYVDSCNGNFSNLHGYAYDGVWVMALALHRVISRIGEDVFLQENSSYDVGGDVIFDLFMEAMNETDFIGVTGPVRFHDGDRLGTIVYEQYQDGREQKVGEYYAHDDSFILMDNIQWKGGSPPADRPIVNIFTNGVSFILYVIMGSFSYLGIMTALMFLFFNMKFRKHRYIKMSSPFLNNLIIIGGIICYSYIYLLGLDGININDRTFENICTVRSWMLAVGFTIAFGAMFSKTWRVYSIFTNIKMKKKVIKDNTLYGIVGMLLLFDVVILVAWGLKDPLRRTEEEGPEQLLELRRDPKGEERKIRCNASKGSLRLPPSASSADLSLRMKCLKAENVKLTRQLSEKDRQISCLLEKLGMKHSYHSESSQSNYTRDTSTTFVLSDIEKEHSMIFKTPEDEDISHISVNSNENIPQSVPDYDCVYIGVPVHVCLPITSKYEGEDSIDKVDNSVVDDGSGAQLLDQKEDYQMLGMKHSYHSESSQSNYTRDTSTTFVLSDIEKEHSMIFKTPEDEDISHISVNSNENIPQSVPDYDCVYIGVPVHVCLPITSKYEGEDSIDKVDNSVVDDGSGAQLLDQKEDYQMAKGKSITDTEEIISTIGIT